MKEKLILFMKNLLKIEKADNQNLIELKELEKVIKIWKIDNL